MNTGPLSIELTFLDGTTDGRIRAELTAWDSCGCIGYKIPRLDFDKCETAPSMSRPGIYILFGRMPSGRTVMYIDADSHAIKDISAINTKNQFGYDWDEAVVLFPDETATENKQLMYLLASFVEKVAEQSSITMVNDIIPPKPIYTKKAQEELNGFLSNSAFVLAALGYPLFKKEYHIDDNDNPSVPGMLFLTSRGANAKGRLAQDNHFVVYRGSMIRHDEYSHCPDGARVLRKEFRGSGKLVNDILMIDYEFKSPSGAAGFVLGAAADGWTEWHDKKNVPLKALFDRKK